MNYLFFQKDTGRITGFSSLSYEPVSGDEEIDFIACSEAIPEWADTHVIVDRKPVPKPVKDPLSRLATRNELNRMYGAVRKIPLCVFGVSLDCDEQSIAAMRSYVDGWEYLEEVPGVIELHDSNGTSEKCVIWRTADNKSECFSLPVLKTVLDEIQAQLAVRNAITFAKYQQFKSSSATIGDISARENWGV